MATVLTITGWTGGTIDLQSTLYQAGIDWSPNVATRKQSRLSGPIYTDVDETIPIAISAATAALAMSAAHDLTAAMDQAERWRRGENVDAVVLNYKPEGSGITGNFTAVIVGSSNANSIMQLAAGFHAGQRWGEFAVNLQLTRRGLWSGDSDTAASGSAIAPVVVSGTFTNSEDLAVPVDIANELIDGANSITIDDDEFYILTTNAANKLQLIDATTVTSANWLSFVDAKARGGTAVHLTTTSQAFIPTATATLTIPATGRSIAVFANMRVVSGDDMLIHAGVEVGTSPVPLLLPSVLVPNDNTIAWRYLGSFQSNDEITGLKLRARTLTGTNSRIEVDDFVCMATDGEDWNVLHVIEGVTPQSDTAGMTFNMQTKYLEEITPLLSLEYSTVKSVVAYEGTPFSSMTGNVAAMMLLGVFPSTNYWQFVSSANNPVSISFDASRKRGYLVPV